MFTGQGAGGEWGQKASLGGVGLLAPAGLGQAANRISSMQRPAKAPLNQAGMSALLVDKTGDRT